MIDGKRVLAVIPARQGSKGLPGKNTRMLAGKPLLGWTIAAAQNSQLIDRLVLSTNDSLAMNYARSVDCEVPFSRSEELSSDTVAVVDVVLVCNVMRSGDSWSSRMNLYMVSVCRMCGLSVCP